jgi:hypothetical protein
MATTTTVAGVLGVDRRVIDRRMRRFGIRCEVPATGSGSRRAFTAADVDRLAVILAMFDAGHRGRRLQRIADQLSSWDPFPLFVVVDSSCITRPAHSAAEAAAVATNSGGVATIVNVALARTGLSRANRPVRPPPSPLQPPTPHDQHHHMTLLCLRHACCK